MAGSKVKGGMWCDRCDRPVLGQKNTHGVRNTLAGGAALATFNPLPLLGAKNEGYLCPICGGPVHRYNPGHSGSSQHSGGWWFVMFLLGCLYVVWPLMIGLRTDAQGNQHYSAAGIVLEVVWVPIAIAVAVYVYRGRHQPGKAATPPDPTLALAPPETGSGPPQSEFPAPPATSQPHIPAPSSASVPVPAPPRDGAPGAEAERSPGKESVAGRHADLVADLGTLADLHQQGLLTSEEFDLAKGRLLSRAESPVGMPREDEEATALCPECGVEMTRTLHVDRRGRSAHAWLCTAHGVVP